MLTECDVINALVRVVFITNQQRGGGLPSSPPPSAAICSSAWQRRGTSRTSPHLEMAADRTRTTLEETDDVRSSDFDPLQDVGSNIPKRHARVTVKYNRKALQRRLDVEKWIDESLDRLYLGQVSVPE